MKLTLFIGGFARAGEIAARLRLATNVVLLPVAIAATAAASASAPSTATAFAARSVLRRSIRLEGGRSFTGDGNVAVACRNGSDRCCGR